MKISKMRWGGFTLLEVMLAVCVLGLVSVGIYGFVEGTLRTVRVAGEREQEYGLVMGFGGYLRAQMLGLPPTRAGAVTGEAHRFNGVSSDELCWVARPGSGLLTRHAAVGEWKVTLTAKEVGRGEYELGLRRQDVEGKRDADWLRLFGGVRGFEVRYFDGERKEWMEKWTDVQTRPGLVRVRLWRDPEPEAYDIIIPVAVRGQAAGGGL